MDELYQSDEIIALANDKPLIDFEAEAGRIAKAIFAGKIKSGDIDPKLTEKVADKLAETVSLNFKKNVAFGSDDALMMEQLEKNAFQFAAAKNYNQIKSMSEALTDSEGKIRSYKTFKEEAAKINRIYNDTWLRTEYETALSSAQNAARWVEFKGRKGKVILTYSAVSDERTRHSHRAINGTTLPMSDPWWSTNYPPNGWRCRCGVEVAGSGKRQTVKSSLKKIAIPSMFRTNLAKDGMLFPPTHPYFKNAPKSVRVKAEKLYKKKTK